MRNKKRRPVQPPRPNPEIEYIRGIGERVRKHYQDYPDLELAYELDDPKHPTYMARLIERVDNGQS